MADGQHETPADETKKLTAKEQITELESRLRESNEALATATKVLQGQESRLNAIEARLGEARPMYPPWVLSWRSIPMRRVGGRSRVLKAQA